MLCTAQAVSIEQRYLSGHLVKVWDSLEAAARRTMVAPEVLAHAASEGYALEGYLWTWPSFEDEEHGDWADVVPDTLATEVRAACPRRATCPLSRAQCEPPLTPAVHALGQARVTPPRRAGSAVLLHCAASHHACWPARALVASRPWRALAAAPERRACASGRRRRQRA